jgi:hypothetical protein
MSSTRGPAFTSPINSPTLQTCAAELTRLLPRARPANPGSRLILRRAQHTGLGVFVKDHCTVPHGVPVAAYWGHLTDAPPPHRHYLLELPATDLGLGPTTLYVDAHRACLRGDPTPDQAALLNHCCEDPTCAGRWFYSPESALPIMVLYTRRSLRGGSELTYNYDAHQRSGAYTMDRATAMAFCHTEFPCKCAGEAHCPLDRFFP